MSILRFPEFRDAPGWKERLLADVLHEHGRKSDGQSEVHSVSVHKGIVNQVEHLGRSFAASDTSQYNLVLPGDIVYTKSPTGDFPYGIVKQNKLGKPVIVSPLYGVFTPETRDIGTILDAYFESAIRTNNYLAPITQKGAKNTIQISNSTFLSRGLVLPSLSTEQRKIAECLTSLDELIAAEGRKLEALRAHKKSLMQNLFPREGETTPRLRFPEFQTNGQWNETSVGMAASAVVAGGTPDTGRPEYWNGDIRWMNSGELNLKRVHEVRGKITTHGLRNSSTRVIPEGSVLIGLAGQGKTRGTVAMNMIELCTNQSIAAILPNRERFIADFLYHELDRRYNELRRLSAGGEGRGGLNLQIIKSLKLHLPSLDEQMRIASCLTSVDALIKAQSDKLTILKAHKQGLLQGLFPEVQG